MRDARTGAIALATGRVTQDEIGAVVLEKSGGTPETYAAGRVQRIEFGDVPEAYREGHLFSDKGDLANAAAKFKVAASDAETRDCVRASARLLAADTLLRHGAVDPSAYTDADTSATRYLEDFPNGREVPRARMLRARAQFLGGDVAKAAEEFKGIHREAAGSTPTPGYDQLFCYRAGLRAADAYLALKETLAAREIYQSIEAAVPGVIAGRAEEDPERPGLLAVQAEARLGEGFVLLASGSVAQAQTFFEQQDVGEESHPALRFGVKLGLGLVHLTQGEPRQASLHFATVSSLDHTDRDRVARALIGLAESALALPDSDGAANARTWLRSVLDHYPDSIWVRRAQELVAKL